MKVDGAKAVLGIDAAWTLKEPSGVALMVEQRDRWRCVGLAPSCEQFERLGDGEPVDWGSKPQGGMLHIDKLLSAASKLLSDAQLCVITVDMPLSLEAIAGRREADRAVSRAFGARGCSTHSPSATRPGNVSLQLTRACAERSYPLATADTPSGYFPALLEVYPHPALLALMQADYRIPYKVSRRNRYWPKNTVEERKKKLLAVFRRIQECLAQRVADIEVSIPVSVESLSFNSLKRYEDALDALVSAWVGIQHIEKRSHAYGDQLAAIWVPD